MPSPLLNLVFDAKAFSSKDDFIANVPPGLSGRRELFQVLRGSLGLPDYFGENWDALSECLRDLSWIKARRVVIVHQDLPGFDARTLAAYLDLLLACVRDWKPGEDHELFVVFPETARDAVLDIIDKGEKHQKA
jgi:RNAse (barnase) inhibitor barstar